MPFATRPPETKFEGNAIAGRPASDIESSAESILENCVSCIRVS